MTPETKKRCEQAMQLMAKGKTQTEAIKEVGIGTATIARYKASLKTSDPHPVLPHSKTPTQPPKASIVLEIPDNTRRLQHENNQLEELLKRITLDNEKLKRQNRILKTLANEFLNTEE